MRRIPLALALVGAFIVTGCMGGKSPASSTDSGVQKGVTGQYYFVNFFQPPVGGYVTSDVGGINCGASDLGITPDATTGTVTSGTQTMPPVPPATTGVTSTCTVAVPCVCSPAAPCKLTATPGVPAWYGPSATPTPPAAISSVCGATTTDPDTTNKQTKFLWSQTVVLTATAVAPNTFIGWAGDCKGSTTTCTLANGADKSVVAIFSSGQAGHGNFMNPLDHGPAYTSGTLDCAKCHGGTLAGQGLAPACSDCHGPLFNPNPLAPAGQLAASKKGMNIAVTSVTSTATNIVVQFTVKDDLNANIDLTGADLKNQVIGPRFGLASFKTTGVIVSPYATLSGGGTSTNTAPAVGAPATTNGQLTGTPGSYTYTFPPSVKLVAANVADTHTVWILASRQENLTKADARTFTAVNAEFNFIPGAINVAVSSPASVGREIVSSAGCYKCHNGFKPETLTSVGGFHGYGRIDAAICNLCHYAGRTNAAYGANSADSAVLFHRIHAAKQIGLPTTLQFQGITATYPQAVENCAGCHSGAAQGDQWKTRPTRAACGSCHYTVNFATGAGHSVSNIAQPDDTLCSSCHNAAYITSKHIPVMPIDPLNSYDTTTGGNSRTNAASIAAAGALPPGADQITAVLSSVDIVSEGTSVPQARRPVLTFKLQRNGTDVVFPAFSSTANLMPNFVGTLAAYVVFSVPQDGITAPADFNASVSTDLRKVLRDATNGTTSGIVAAGPDGSGFYTIKFATISLPANAVNVTGGLGYAYSLPATQPLTQTNVAGYPMNASGSGGLIVPIPNVWKPLTGTTGRRAIVDNAKCQACHAPLGVEPTFHVAQRNDGPTCSFCHNPNQSSNGWSANASTFVHGIHGASIRTVPFSWHSGGCAVGSTWNALKRQCEVAGVAVEPAAPWFPEVEYPNQLKNCEACHVAGSYDFSNSDSAAAVTKLLWATVGKDTYTNDSPSNSPYVAFGSSYGVGPSFSATTMALTAGASTSLVNSPISGACFSCHDSTDARTHMEAHGGAIYRARSAGMTGESCLGCHGSTGTWSIKEMHK